MICYQKKRKCGNKDLENSGCMKETKIPGISIVELLTGNVMNTISQPVLVCPMKRYISVPVNFGVPFRDFLKMVYIYILLLLEKKNKSYIFIHL